MPCPNYPGEPIASNLDARVISTGNPVEAKTGGIIYPQPHQWGDDGSDHVPDHNIIQCQTQMFCCVKDICHNPSLVGGRGLMMYEIERNEKLIDLIRESVAEYIEKYVKTDTPPPDSVPHFDVLKRVRRVPKKVVEIKPELVRQYLDDAEAAKEAKKIADESKALVIAQLGDAEAGEAGALGSVTYFEQTRKEHIVKESTFRVLRYKKAKS
jgi:hypothetical protein